MDCDTQSGYPSEKFMESDMSEDVEMSTEQAEVPSEARDKAVPFTAPDITRRSRELMDLGQLSQDQKAELALLLIGHLRLDQLGEIHRRVMPLLQLDILTTLPTELALHALSFLTAKELTTVSLVSRQWKNLTNDQSLWRHLCKVNGWKWKRPRLPTSPSLAPIQIQGSGQAHVLHDQQPLAYSRGRYHIQEDEGFNDDEGPDSGVILPDHADALQQHRARFSAPPSFSQSLLPVEDYKLLFKTRSILRSRLRRGDFRMIPVQTPPFRTSLDGDGQQPQFIAGHRSTVYALCLGNDYQTREPALFTASRDQRIIQWSLARDSTPNAQPSSSEDLLTSAPSPPSNDNPQVQPMRVFRGAHLGSVLSICVAEACGLLISGGSDGRIVIWSLRSGLPVHIIVSYPHHPPLPSASDHAALPQSVLETVGYGGHEDSVLCVRCDERRIVSCGKDRTIRTFRLPTFEPHLVLRSHRAAINALSLHDDLIVSASGDRSVRLWDANNGDLLRTFEGHHSRGLASIDFCFPYIVTGSSDQHVRFFDLITHRGWGADPSHALSGLSTAAAGAGTGGLPAGLLHTPLTPGFGQTPMSTAFPTPSYTHRAIQKWKSLVRSRVSRRPLRSSSSRQGRGHGNAIGSPVWRIARHSAPSANSPMSMVGPSSLFNNGSFGLPELDSPSDDYESDEADDYLDRIPEACPMCDGDGQISPLDRFLFLSRSAQMSSTMGTGSANQLRRGHQDLVRTVAMDDDVVLSGSYDATIKVWDRKSGSLLADLTNGHTGRIFGLAFDCTKIVSCGEDERICIWDLAWGLDTSFVET